eukprot:IDg5483t1
MGDAANKSKRFRFDKHFDQLLVHTVSIFEAHIVKHGEVEQKFEGVLNAFCAHPTFLEKHEKGVPAPKQSTLRDRFTKLLANRRAMNKNIAASGIPEEYGELEKSLDTIIDECEEKKEAELEGKKEVGRKRRCASKRGAQYKRLCDEKEHVSWTCN